MRRFINLSLRFSFKWIDLYTRIDYICKNTEKKLGNYTALWINSNKFQPSLKSLLAAACPPQRGQKASLRP